MQQRVKGVSPVRRRGHLDATMLPQGRVVATNPYKSKWELQYSKVLELEKRVGAIKDWRYGGISFTLSKKQYHRIDFLIWHTNGQIELAQVKGYHKNLRAGIKGLKWAAQLHPWFSWTIKRWTGTAWDGEYVEV